ncbi:MAG TPA: hypothetical protein VMY16_07635 [Ilumatobacteraceae bacterium]|nr:hypothetical protein [Ilumatobacteraceae bacterium]
MKAVAVAVLLAAALLGCGGDDESTGGPSFVADIRPAIEAVDAELGPGQEFFEITANELVTNLFVAIDGATAAVPFVYLDGELQPPAPTLTGASGFTFSADDLDFDADTVLDSVSEELTESTIEAFSIEGGAGGVVRYVVSTLSPEGGRLDVTVSPDGTILAVDPL